MQLDKAGLSVKDDTLYSSLLSEMSAAEYAVETRNLHVKEVHDRKQAEV